jgi:hypothetical protein
MRAKSVAWALIAAGLGLKAAAALAAPVADGAGAAVDSTVTVQEETTTDDLLMRREKYFYSSFARRDPFASLISGDFASTNGDDLLDIGEITLVGVMWGKDDKFAIVQDQRKHVHVLRVGDRVVNGKVIAVTKTSLTVQHYFFGESVNVTIQMNQGEGVNETR